MTNGRVMGSLFDHAPEPDASACYPFATPPDFGVAAYVINDEKMGITCNLRVRVFVNPKADIGTQPRDVRFVPKADMKSFEDLVGATE